MSFILFFAPIPIALLTAFFTGRLLERRATTMSGGLKVFVGGLAGVVAPVAYLWIWQTIEVAMREARGDTSEYMGPLVLLVYGYPVFIIVWILCFVFAAFAVRRAK